MGVLPSSQWAPVFTVRRRGGGAVDSLRIPAAANQTILKGQLLVHGTAGSAGKMVQAITTALSNGQGVQSGGSLGSLYVALEDKSTGAVATEDDVVVVMPLRGQNEALLQVANFAASAGVLGSAAATQKDDVLTGTAYRIGLYNNGGVLQYGLSTNTANGDLTIVEKSPESDPADTYTRVWVTKSF
jgi:phosphohistidine swiveling domain-containing protein